MPKDIKKWKDRLLANGTTCYPSQWNWKGSANPPLLAYLPLNMKRYQLSQLDSLVVTGIVPEDSELMAFF